MDNKPDQRVKDTLVLHILKFMFKPETAQRLENMAKNEENPAEVIAAQTAMALKVAVDSLAQKGEEVDPRYYLPVGKEVMAHLVEMLVVFKVIPAEQAKGATAAAFREFVDIIGANPGSQQQPPQEAQPAPGGLIQQGA